MIKFSRTELKKDLFLLIRQKYNFSQPIFKKIHIFLLKNIDELTNMEIKKGGKI